MTDYKNFKKQLLKDKEIKKAYKNLAPKFAKVNLSVAVAKRLK
ncbi:MAG: hypothetical protein P4L74_03695 [Candidatus Doudnabacteria bacterium]|nr:hypothetical protein [Candidatus Doudnabacteria bacterium]